MLEINQLTVEFGIRALFRDVTLQLYPGHRYGLIGANGSGKSTLLQILMGQSSEYSGQIHWPKEAEIGFLKQDHFAYENQPILTTVIQGNQKLWQALCLQEKLTAQSEMDLADSTAYAEAEGVIQQEGGYSAESEAARLLIGLGIPAPRHQDLLNTFSGGYKLRVLLAQLLFSKPEILLLDEPTNHLDIFSIKWLEDYLRTFPGLLLVVSHDRDFLNAVSTDILDIDYGEIREYTGNYNAFEAAKALEKEQKEQALASQEKKKEELQAFINRFKAKATKASQAQSRVKTLEKMEEIEILPSSRSYPHFKFAPHRPSGLIPLMVDNLSKAFEDKQVLNQIQFEVERGERIALIGPNGIGKSTLLKLIMAELPADTGEVKWGHEALPGYFPQDYHGVLNGDLSAYDWLYQFDTTAEISVIRNLLGRMLFKGDAVHHKVSTLSGGEATRLIFAKLMLLPSNILLLDEPTNHLDMESIDALTEALKNYTGTLIFVSHNRYFVSQVANRILELQPEGLRDFKGSYSEYLEKQGTDHLTRQVRLKDRDVLSQQQLPSGENAKAENKQNYAERKNLLRKKEQLEKKIAQLESLSLNLEEALNQQDEALAKAFETGNTEQQAAIMAKKASLEAELEQALADWEATEEEWVALEI